MIHDFEGHNFTLKEGGSLLVDSNQYDTANQLPIINKKRYGNGLADIIPSITNFIGNNKELISNVSNVAKAAGSVADASSKVTQAVKAAKELGQLKALRTSNTAKKEQEGTRKKKDSSEVAKILNEHMEKKQKAPPFDPQGDGFRKFP